MSEELENVVPVVPEQNNETVTAPAVDSAELVPGSEQVAEVATPEALPETAPETASEPEVESSAETPQPEQKEDNWTPYDDLIEQAIGLITRSGKSATAHIQRKLGLTYAQAIKVVEVLTTKGVLGPDKGGAPRDILIPLQKPKIIVKQRPKKVMMTDEERKARWAENLRMIGKYTDDGFINSLCEFAQKNQGFNPREKRGSCLIVMMNRLAVQLRDCLRSFTPSDSEYIMRELLRFSSESPMGDGPQVWNSRYSSNMEMKKAISEFFGIDKSFRDLRGKQEHVMTAVRAAAWPNINEEKKGTGGSYAERFHYLILCIIAHGCSDPDALFKDMYHEQPTQGFIERFGAQTPTPAWHDGHVCSDCGNSLVTDSNGNTVCSNPICMRHFAAVETDSKSFRNGGGGDRPQQRGGNWKKNNSRDYNEEKFFNRGPKKKGKKFRPRDNDDDQQPDLSEPVATFAPSGESEFKNTPFENLLS